MFTQHPCSSICICFFRIRLHEYMPDPRRCQQRRWGILSGCREYKMQFAIFQRNHDPFSFLGWGYGNGCFLRERIASSILEKSGLGMASSSFFTDFLNVRLYTLMALSFTTVHFIIFRRLGHSVMDRFQIGGIFDHFFDPLQFSEIYQIVFSL